ncbi:unnamed protein product [Vitrella brassicaformis CCMP3155]|uniref:Uncharacterized protein n=1 Tax=Vitrella brassicaformis (strain CCMP3155) TaxID=1169540 RepID=A0A0G4GTK8_VITBC|nr:unnamed protein product [Vitrella brassicaformis CCMP3155]|eukprot:CEM34097.1 unnamed protein product [Vitrella brassicaformis CCMP3155]
MVGQPPHLKLGWSGFDADGDGTAIDGEFDGSDIRSCYQYIDSEYLPEGYMGVRDEDGDAVLGGSLEFTADEIEVLRVLR